MIKIRLTKKRLKALYLGITLDDILYAKFNRMYQEFNRECREWNKRKQVIRVLQNKGKVNYVLQIIQEVKTPEGILVVVR